MRLVRIFAGLGVLALAGSLNAAQHGGGSGHAAGGGHVGGAHPTGVAVPHPAVGGGTAAARPSASLPPISSVQMQHGRAVYLAPPLVRPNPLWRFPQIAPVRPSGASAAFAPTVLYERPWIPPQSELAAERFRRFRYFQLPYIFFLGAGGSLCDSFYPGYFGPELWYDNQFSCFGVPWFGVDSYPSDFLAPDFAYEPWAENLQEQWAQQMYPSVNGQTVGELDMTAGIASRESAESNPSVRVTQLALKEGDIFGLTDYWLEGTTLHYVTTYGRQNAVPLDSVDLDKTIQLNAERGVPFVLQERRAQPPAAPPQAP